MLNPLMIVCLRHELTCMRQYLWGIVIWKYQIPYPESEDVVSETVLGALISMSSFVGEAKFKTWTTRIMMRRAIDYYRKLNRKTKKTDDFPRFIDSEEELFSYQLLKERILTDRKLLKTEERRVARLMLQDYDRAEIAKKLHYSPRNVSAYRANVIKKLREAYIWPG